MADIKSDFQQSQCCKSTKQWVQENFKEKLSDWQTAAQANDPHAQYLIACCYDYGYGVESDPVTAFEYYSKAADQSVAPAQAAAGYCLLNGIGTLPDETTAANLFYKAAHHDDPAAQFNLAYCYNTGTGVDKDMDKAVEWYKKAAENNEPDAQLNLAIHFENGSGVEKNLTEALKWYKTAESNGSAPAVEALARLRQQGEDEFRKLCMGALEDGVLTPDEKEDLKNMKNLYDISSHRAKEIFIEERDKYIQSKK